MRTPPTTPLYKRHRFLAEIISHCVWLYWFPGAKVSGWPDRKSWLGERHKASKVSADVLPKTYAHDTAAPSQNHTE